MYIFAVDGRWAHTEMPLLTNQFYEDNAIDKDVVFFPNEQDAWLEVTDAHLISPYGMLRSPWNWNPSPYLSRYNNVHQIANISSFGNSKAIYSGVTCNGLEDLANLVRDQPFSNFLLYAEDNAHGMLHFTFGGAGGDHAFAVVCWFLSMACIQYNSHNVLFAE